MHAPREKESVPRKLSRRWNKLANAKMQSFVVRLPQTLLGKTRKPLHASSGEAKDRQPVVTAGCGQKREVDAGDDRSASALEIEGGRTETAS